MPADNPCRSMLSEQAIEACVRWACEQEVLAPKPGNVNPFSAGHQMAVTDFLKSANAIAPVMAKPGLSIGERIYQSIQATRKVVDCNTNLGIILLFAPLCNAVQQCQDFDELTTALKRELQKLTIEDARFCYQAIRIAEAGGLGKSEQQDLSQEPTVTLREAMFIAVNRDTIARQYVYNYAEVFHIGLQQLTAAIKSGEGVEWATAFAYLNFLACVPDTLVIRKQSREHAQAVTNKARDIISAMNKKYSLKNMTSDLIAWDNDLKKRAINPGTTADLTAATLLLFAFQQAFASNRISVPRCIERTALSR